MQYLSLGQKLRLKRKELNLTLKDITGDYISPATLSLVERDMQVPSDDLLRYLAEKLQTPFHYFRETPEETLSRRAKTLLAEAEALMYRKRYGMAAHFAEEILEDAKELKIPELIGKSCLLLCNIALEQENYSKANQYLFHAQASMIQSGHHEELPNIYYRFGLVSFTQGFYAQALDYLVQAETTLRQDVDDELHRQILSLLAQAYHKLGQYDQALAVAEQAKELVERMNNLEAYAESLILLGQSYREKEQYDQALERFNEALRLIRQLDAKQEQSEVDHNLASLFVKTGELHKALEHYELAIEQKQQLDDPSVVHTCLELVETLIQIGDLEKAQERLLRTLELLTDYPSDQDRARALALQYQLCHMLGNEKEGRAALEESLQIVRKQPAPKPVADTLVRLGRICASSGDQSTATILFAEALTVYESLGVILNKMIML